MIKICCLLLCIVLATVVCIQAASLERSGVTPEAGGSDDVSEGLWSPDDGVTREDWLRCHGLPCDTFMAVTRKEEQLRQAIARIHGVPLSAPDDTQLGDLESTNPIALDKPVVPVADEDPSRLDSCIMLTEDQLDVMIDNLEAELPSDTETEHHRVKRKAAIFDDNYKMWENAKMVYKFDGAHSEYEQAIIRDATRHWEEQTCIRFEEKATREKVEEHHVLFTRQPTGCHSYVGRTSTNPQQINLMTLCLSEFGIPVHEIGHALGLWHEQQRSDRGPHIKINWGNVGYYTSQFYPQKTRSLGVPYDYSSVMHYKSNDGSSNGKPTMEARDPLFTSTMGQRTGLSFYDAMIINRVYCGHVCNGVRLARACEHGGYQDPNDCGKCRCLDGWSGDYCETVQKFRGEPCGGKYYVGEAGLEIKTPGYNYPGHYKANQECTWHLHAPAGKRLELRFEETFGLKWQHDVSCYHWVEVRYQKGLDQQGPRFCGHQTPKDVVLSQTGEMMVVFRANFSAWNAAMRGFKARVVPVPMPVDGVDSAQAVTETTTTTTTPVTTTPTLNPKTTTVAPKKSDLNWRCDFEMNMCGMTQATNDEFDWTRGKGATPSEETGPDGAVSGSYYLYIETSSPRKRGDKAAIYTPKLRYSGSACVRVSAHMYGFHVNQLLMVKKSGSRSQVIWSQSGQQGNFWFVASEGVKLAPDDQIGLVGVRGGEYSGDIGIDNIIITSGHC